MVKLKLIFDYDGTIYIYKLTTNGMDAICDCVYKKYFLATDSLKRNQAEALEEFQRLQTKYNLWRNRENAK